MRFGVSTSGPNAILRALDFNDVVAVRLLLEYGVDPNEAVETHPSGQPVDSAPVLHHAACRWCSAEIVRLLLDFGADPSPIWQGHTAYAMARIYGNAPMVRVLEEGVRLHRSPQPKRFWRHARRAERRPGSFRPTSFLRTGAS